MIDMQTGLYLIVDYYYELEGAPLLGIMQVRKDTRFTKAYLPDYIQVYADVSDNDTYQPEYMCKLNHKMPENDRLETNAL